MASITVEIVSKTHSKAGTTFVLAASEEEIKRAGFVPYFIDSYFHGVEHHVRDDSMGAVTPYGTIVLGPQVNVFGVYILPFVPALTESDIDPAWVLKNTWTPYKLVKTPDFPNGKYQEIMIGPSMNVGDTLVFYDTKPADPT